MNLFRHPLVSLLLLFAFSLGVIRDDFLKPMGLVLRRAVYEPIALRLVYVVDAIKRAFAPDRGALQMLDDQMPDLRLTAASDFTERRAARKILRDVLSPDDGPMPLFS